MRFDPKPSPWAGNQDVLQYFSNHEPDPLEDDLQSMWVFIEMIKRETAEGDLERVKQAEEGAYASYARALFRIEDAEASGMDMQRARERLTELKRQLRAISALPVPDLIAKRGAKN